MTTTNGTSTTSLTPNSLSMKGADGSATTIVNNQGITITPAEGKTVSLTDKGLDNGGNKITNVAAGEVNSTSTDAINGSQLNNTNSNVTKNAEDITNLQKGWKLDASATGSGTVTAHEETAVKTDDTVTMRAGNNLSVAQDGKTVTYSLKDKVTLGSDANQVTLDGTSGTVTLGKTTTGPMVTINGNTGSFNIGGEGGVTLKQGTKAGTSDTTYELTGLTNKTLDAADYAQAGRAATEEQLEKLKQSLGDVITTSATKMDNGTNATVSGVGTSADPFKVNVNPILKNMQEIQLDKGDNRGALNGGGLYLTKASNMDPSDPTKILDPTQEVRYAVNGVSAGMQTVDNVKSAIADQTGDSYLEKLKTANESTTPGTDTAGLPKNSAVNVSDLYNTASGLENKGLDFVGNDGDSNKVHRNLGTTLSIKGGMDAATVADDTKVSNKNVGVRKNGDGLELVMSDTPEFTSVKTGNTTVNTSGVTIKGSEEVKNVTLTDKGLSNGGNQITHVASGLGDTKLADASGDTLNNAVNVGDLKKASSTVVKGTNIASIDTVSDEHGTSYTINAKGAAVAAGANTHVSAVTDDTTHVITYTVHADKAVVTHGTGLIMDTQTATDGATGAVTTTYKLDLSEGTKAKIDNGQTAYDTVNNKGITFQGDTDDTTQKKLGDTMVINGDQNITTAVATDGSMKVKLNSDLKDIASIANTKTITDPGSGATKTTGTTIKLSESDNAVDAGGAVINNIASGKIAADSREAVNGSQIKNISDSVKNIIGGSTTVNNDGTITSTGIANTGKTNVSDAITAARTTVASADGTVKVTDTETNGAHAYDLSITRTELITDDAGKAGTKTTDNGFVTANDVVNAINKSGFSLKASAADGGTVVTTGAEIINPGDSVEMVAGKNMKVTQAANGKITYATKDDLDVNSVTAKTTDGGKTVTTIVNGKGITITKEDSTGGSVSLTDKGLSNGGNQITNIASGLGDTKLADASGSTLTNAANIGDLQKAINNSTGDLTDKGLKFGADSGSDVTNKLGSTVTVSGDKKNLSTTVSQDAYGNTTIGVALAQELKGLTSAEFKNGSTTTTVDGGGITIKPSAGDLSKSVSLTDKGLSNGGNQITNVASGGTTDTNAANIGDVKKAAAAATTKVTNADSNIVVTKDTTAPDGSTTYKVGLADKVTMGKDPSKQVSLDGTAGTITAGTGDNAVKINGTNGTIQAGDKIILDGKNGTAAIDKVKINGTAGTVSGLTNKTTTYEGFADGSGKAATEEQLKELKDAADKAASSHTAVTVNGGTEAPSDGSYSNGNLQLKESKDEATGKTTYDLKLADNMSIGKNGKDGVDGKIGVNGTDGNSVVIDGKDGSVGAKGADGSAVVINGKDGSIGLTGKDGKNGLTIQGEAGKVGVDGKDGSTRMVYTDAEGKKNQLATMNDGLKFKGDDDTVISKKLNEQVDIIGGADVKNLTENNIGVNSTSDGKLKVQLAKNLTGLNSVSANTVTASQSVTIGSGDAITTLKTVTSKGADGKSISALDVGGNKITNVAAGTISKTSTDAVNGSQLYKVEAKADNNTNTINHIGNTVNALGDRVDKVGAGAAALAALHPLDFDPDDKWDFAAGYGNYRGAHAAAVGAFYRPNEDILLSVGGSFGGGENMVNAGVTFKLGQKNHVSTSKVAMAKEIIDLKATVAELKAQNERIMAVVNAMGTGAINRNVSFPDVPADHWAYQYVKSLADRGLLEGYPDGEFKGNRSMTRYEFAAIIYRALQNGAPVDGNMGRAMDEFGPELEKVQTAERFRVDRISGKDNDRHKIERVRVNNKDDKANKDYRDVYGSHIQK